MSIRDDERRSAHLLFAREIARGDVTIDDVATREVMTAVTSKPVPSRLSRELQRFAVKRGGLDAITDLGALHEARRSVLGDAASGPPRFLIRVDELPHAQATEDPERFGTGQFARFHAVLRDAGVPYLLAVLPRAPLAYLDPEEKRWREIDATERDLLADLRRDGITFATHALDHRTRSADPRKHSELLGLSEDELEDRLATADAVLDELALPHDVFVPPFNRFAHRQWRVLARRYEVVCGGPETVRLMGWHRAPLWRGNAVYLPCHDPLYGRAEVLVPQVQRLVAENWAVWVPLTLHWSWETDRGLDGVERLATALAGVAASWDELLTEVRASAEEAG